MVRVVIPFHLRALAKIDGEVQLEVEGPVTQRSVLDALEARAQLRCVGPRIPRVDLVVHEHARCGLGDIR